MAPDLNNASHIINTSNSMDAAVSSLGSQTSPRLSTCGRDRECRQLLARFSQRPDSILAVLGTADCGKTEFLKDMMQQKVLGDTACYVDCHVMAAEGSNLADSMFAGELLRGLIPVLIRCTPSAYWDRLQRNVEYAFALLNRQMFTGYAVDNRLNIATGIEGTPSRSILESYPQAQRVTLLLTEMLDVWKLARDEGNIEGHQWPTLIIDQVNSSSAAAVTESVSAHVVMHVLLLLSRVSVCDQAQELEKLSAWDMRDLLKFFSLATKKGLCHVVLVGNGLSLSKWLCKSEQLMFYSI